MYMFIFKEFNSFVLLSVYVIFTDTKTVQRLVLTGFSDSGSNSMAFSTSGLSAGGVWCIARLSTSYRKYCSELNGQVWGKKGAAATPGAPRQGP